MVAVKVLETDAIDFKAEGSHRDTGLEDALKEIGVLQRLQQGKAVNVNTFIEAFQLYSQLWIVSEYCSGGSLSTLRRASSGKFAERHIVPIARELALGLKSVHDAGIIHRDVKCQFSLHSAVVHFSRSHALGGNVMIDEHGNLLIIDFGVAGILLSSLDVDKRKTVIGTPHWMAPEMHSTASEVAHGTEVDVWAYGITLYECATGAPPNARTANPAELRSRVRNTTPRLADDRFSEELRDLIAFALDPDPKARPSMAQICQHPYIAGTAATHPTSSLKELVEGYYQWERSGGQRFSLFMPGGAAKPQEVAIADDDQEEWSFSTTAKFDEAHFAERPVYQDQYGNYGELSASPPRESEEQAAPPKATTRYLLEQEPSIHELMRAPSIRSAASSRHPSTSRGQKPTREASLSRPRQESRDVSRSRPQNRSGEPSTSRAPATFAGDSATERRVARGAMAMQGLFDASASPYKYSYGSSSDLPLRTSDSSSSLHRKEVSVGSASGTNAPAQINLDAIPNKKAEKRATMAWKWSDGGAGDLESSEAGPSEPSAAPTTTPVRPTLRHAATMPVEPLDRPVSNTLDLDALMGADSFTMAAPPSSFTYDPPRDDEPTPMPRQEPTFGGSFLLSEPSADDDDPSLQYTMRAAPDPRTASSTSSYVEHTPAPDTHFGSHASLFEHHPAPTTAGFDHAAHSAMAAPHTSISAPGASFDRSITPSLGTSSTAPGGMTSHDTYSSAHDQGFGMPGPAAPYTAQPHSQASLPMLPTSQPTFGPIPPPHMTAGPSHLPPPIPPEALANDAPPETMHAAFTGVLGNWMGMLQQNLDALNEAETSGALAAELGITDDDDEEDDDELEDEDDEEGDIDDGAETSGGSGREGYGGDAAFDGFGEPGDDVGRHDESETDGEGGYGSSSAGYGSSSAGGGGYSASGFAAGAASAEGSDVDEHGPGDDTSGGDEDMEERGRGMEGRR